MALERGNDDNSLINSWFNNKTLDTNGDGRISKDKLSFFEQKVAQKPESETLSEDLLADALLNSSISGNSFFDLASAFDAESGLSKQDLETFAYPAGNNF